MKRLIINKSHESKVSAKRRIRKNLILKELRDRGTLSFTEVAKITHFSLPMVSDLTKDLEKEGFVIPVIPNQLKVGRPPNSVKINPCAGYIIGIDIGHTAINIVVVNLIQERIYERTFPSIDIKENQLLVDKMVENVNNIIKHLKIPNDSILGIGIAIPGLVNSQKGDSYTYLNFEDETTQKVFENRFNNSIRIENDVKAMALGEIGFGKAKEIKNAACINLGWGIGMSLILNGEIYYGKSGFAGEFGHIIIEEKGPLCHCGKRGCLETVASGRAIGQIARDTLNKGIESQIKYSIDSIDNVDEETIVEYARRGDQFSIEILEKAGVYIGKTLGKLINLFNPELIILGGRGSRADEFILYPIRTAALHHSLVELGKDAKIVISDLGDMAGCLGATTLITREIFETSHINMGRYI